MKEIRLKIVKLCDNMEERAQGLMNFRKLKEDECAFFIFPKASGHYSGIKMLIMICHLRV